MGKSAGAGSGQGPEDVRDSIERCGRIARLAALAVIAVAVLYFGAITLLAPR